MTRRPTDTELEAMIASGPREVPREHYAARLRRDFVEGRLGAEPSARRRRPVRVAAWLSLALAAAAAVIVAVSAPWDTPSSGAVPVAEQPVADAGVPDVERLPPLPPWRLRARSRHPGVDVDALLAAFVAGEDLSSGMVTFDLVSSDELSLRLLPQTTIRATRADVDGERLVVRVLDGELLIRTPRDYAGAPMTFSTAQADVAVVGTALSVMADASGTCVCVSHGVVEVTDTTDDAAPVHRVTADETCFVFEAGRHATYLGPARGLLGDYEAEHRAPLLRFDER